MKKSDLKSYIRENIIEILSEESVEDIKAQTDAYKDLAKAKEEAGIEEEVSPTIRQKKKRPNAS
jgi:hypothetical protein